MILGSRLSILAIAAVLGTSACKSEEPTAPVAAPQGAEQPQAAPDAAPVPEPVPAIGDAAAADAREEWIIWADGDPWDGPAPLTVEFECDLMEEVPNPTFEWDFGDGSPVSNESHPVYTYTRPGRYNARCRVTDPSGGEGEDFVVIDVDPAEEDAAEPAGAAPPAEDADAAHDHEHH